MHAVYTFNNSNKNNEIHLFIYMAAGFFTNNARAKELYLLLFFLQLFIIHMLAMYINIDESQEKEGSTCSVI